MKTHFRVVNVTLTMLAIVSLLGSLKQPASAQEPLTAGNSQPTAQPFAAPRADRLPLSTSSSYSAPANQLSIAQQRAIFAANQRVLRMEFNNWIGYSPLRPTVNGSYMSTGYPRYYIPQRGVFVSATGARAWYW